MVLRFVTALARMWAWGLLSFTVVPQGVCAERCAVGFNTAPPRTHVAESTRSKPVTEITSTLNVLPSFFLACPRETKGLIWEKTLLKSVESYPITPRKNLFNAILGVCEGLHRSLKEPNCEECKIKPSTWSLNFYSNELRYRLLGCWNLAVGRMVNELMR